MLFKSRKQRRHSSHSQPSQRRKSTTRRLQLLEKLEDRRLMAVAGGVEEQLFRFELNRGEYSRSLRDQFYQDRHRSSRFELRRAARTVRAQPIDNAPADIQRPNDGDQKPADDDVKPQKENEQPVAKEESSPVEETPTTPAADPTVGGDSFWDARSRTKAEESPQAKDETSPFENSKLAPQAVEMPSVDPEMSFDVEGFLAPDKSGAEDDGEEKEKTDDTGDADKPADNSDPEESDADKKLILLTVPEKLEGSHDFEYRDKGATCHDRVDQPRNRERTDRGRRMSRDGYRIRYDCDDLSGNQAQRPKRPVVIQDHSRPRIQVIPPGKSFQEAGFPYTDHGAEAKDSLDGESIEPTDSGFNQPAPADGDDKTPNAEKEKSAVGDDKPGLVQSNELSVEDKQKMDKMLKGDVLGTARNQDDGVEQESSNFEGPNADELAGPEFHRDPLPHRGYGNSLLGPGGVVDQNGRKANAPNQDDGAEQESSNFEGPNADSGKVEEIDASKSLQPSSIFEGVEWNLDRRLGTDSDAARSRQRTDPKDVLGTARNPDDGSQEDDCFSAGPQSADVNSTVQIPKSLLIDLPTRPLTLEELMQEAPKDESGLGESSNDPGENQKEVDYLFGTSFDPDTPDDFPEWIDPNVSAPFGQPQPHDLIWGIDLEEGQQNFELDDSDPNHGNNVIGNGQAVEKAAQPSPEPLSDAEKVTLQNDRIAGELQDAEDKAAADQQAADKAQQEADDIENDIEGPQGLKEQQQDRTDEINDLDKQIKDKQDEHDRHEADFEREKELGYRTGHLNEGNRAWRAYRGRKEAANDLEDLKRQKQQLENEQAAGEQQVKDKEAEQQVADEKAQNADQQAAESKAQRDAKRAEARRAVEQKRAVEAQERADREEARREEEARRQEEARQREEDRQKAEQEKQRQEDAKDPAVKKFEAWMKKRFEALDVNDPTHRSIAARVYYAETGVLEAGVNAAALIPNMVSPPSSNGAVGIFRTIGRGIVNGFYGLKDYAVRLVR